MAQNKQPHRYYTAQELQHTLGFSERASLRRLRRNGWIIDPDIQIGGTSQRVKPKYGWDPDEVIKYGVETGRLRPDGTLTGEQARPGWRAGGPPEHWRKRPRHYLSISEIPDLVGMDQVTLWKLRRLVPIPAAVQLGSHHGYTRRQVLRWFDEVTADARRMDVSPVTLQQMRVEDQRRRQAS